MRKTVRIGILEGLVSHVPDFMEPMSTEELREWEGDPLEPRTADKDRNIRTARPAASDDPTGSQSA